VHVVSLNVFDAVVLCTRFADGVGRVCRYAAHSGAAQVQIDACSAHSHHYVNASAHATPLVIVVVHLDVLCCVR
jgi:hypothetical protein